MDSAVFYVIDVDGEALGDESVYDITDGKESYNEFESYRKAASIARKISRENEGAYSVSVMCPGTYWRNGKEFDD